MSRRGLIVTLIIGCFVGSFWGLHYPTPKVQGAAVLPADFEDALVTGVGGPTSLAFTPDGRLLITTQGGQLRIYQNGALLASPALDLSSVVCSNSERGLLGVAADPQFATNHFIYLYYTFNKFGVNPCPTGQPTNPNNPVNRVARFTLNNNNTIDPASQLILVDNIISANGNHNGGDVQFGKDGLLYISVGDGGADYAGDSGAGGANDAARDKHVMLGKILRITSAGGIPASNPHQAADSGRCNVTGSTTVGNWCQEIFATGLRNPFRIVFDPNAAGTRFFINDVGQGTWEEIDDGLVGADYGWNIREGHCLNGSTSNCPAPPPGLTNPIFDYPHTSNCGASGVAGNSITGGAFVPTGLWPAEYNGVYLFGEFVCGKIFRLNPISGGYSASEFATGLGGSSAVAMLFGPYQNTQALYYTTYASGGEVRRIRYTGSTSGAPPVVNDDQILADFNADGRADIAGRHQTTGDIQVGLSNGTQILGSSSWGNWSLNYDILFADVNNDGRADIVGRHQTTGDVQVGLSNGATFLAPTSWGNWPLSYDLHLADLNNDGRADLVGRHQTTGNVQAALSNGTQFQAPTTWCSWSLSYDIHFADMNNDGRADIAGRHQTTGDVQVGLSNGTNIIGSTRWCGWSLSYDIHFADMNNDGRADLVGRNLTTGNVQVGLSDGTKIMSSTTWCGWSLSYDFHLADMNGDGRADIGGRHQTTGNVQVGLSNGTQILGSTTWCGWSLSYNIYFVG